MVRVFIAVTLVLFFVACEKRTQTETVAVSACEKGLGKKQVNDLIAILGEFNVTRPADIQLFLGKLGGPKYPTVAANCYDVDYIDVLAAVIPKRMVSFKRSPFQNSPESFQVKSTYKNLIKEFADATLGEWKPDSIRVFYKKGNGVVFINFESFDEKYKWRVDQHEAIDRVGDEFFDSLVKLEVNKLSGMYFNLSNTKQARFAYLPKKLVPELSRMGVK